jgi:hypothetical protein
LGFICPHRPQGAGFPVAAKGFKKRREGWSMMRVSKAGIVGTLVGGSFGALMFLAFHAAMGDDGNGPAVSPQDDAADLQTAQECRVLVRDDVTIPAAQLPVTTCHDVLPAVVPNPLPDDGIAHD